MHMKNKKGFTLIELLVVIAIIGILSSVVLASLNTARAKGADAAIKADLGTIRTQAAIYFEAGGHYGVDTNSCGTASSLFVDPTIASAITNAEQSSGGSATCYADDGDSSSGSAATSWAVSLPLRTDPLQSWCADSAGVNALGTATLVGDVAVCQ
jgi:prepilin-type N-terminal cleavage/methylation domain-containing protein